MSYCRACITARNILQESMYISPLHASATLVVCVCVSVCVRACCVRICVWCVLMMDINVII